MMVICQNLNNKNNIWRITILTSYKKNFWRITKQNLLSYYNFVKCFWRVTKKDFYELLDKKLTSKSVVKFIRFNMIWRSPDRKII